MKSEFIQENERRIRKENAISVVKKIAVGTCVVLIVGVCAYAFLLLLMKAI